MVKIADHVWSLEAIVGLLKIIGMDALKKVVTQLPLRELWREDGFTTVSRVRWLTADDIRSLLRAEQIQFVVADLGASLRWIPLGDTYDFWKTEVQAHLALPDSRSSLDVFPNGYCYFASEWSSQESEAPIVVCERHH